MAISQHQKWSRLIYIYRADKLIVESREKELRGKLLGNCRVNDQCVLVLCNKSSSVLSVACNFGPFDVSTSVYSKFWLLSIVCM